MDADGNLRNWWLPEDDRAFLQKAQCVQEGYFQHVVVDKLYGDGAFTLGENIADLGGLALAYEAWKQVMQQAAFSKQEGFTEEQRFFIAYAQSWCTHETDENKRKSITDDPHARSQYRANIVRHFPGFQQAFQCKVGQPMAPQNRCQVW